jgi:hypothetical protein
MGSLESLWTCLPCIIAKRKRMRHWVGSASLLETSTMHHYEAQEKAVLGVGSAYPLDVSTLHHYEAQKKAALGVRVPIIVSCSPAQAQHL